MVAILTLTGLGLTSAQAQHSIYDQGQNVGIGTTSPDAALEIQADWFNPPGYATPEEKKAGPVNLRLDGPAPSALWHHEFAAQSIYALEQMGDGQLDGSLNFYLRRTRPGAGANRFGESDTGWQRVLSLRDDLGVVVDHDFAYQGRQAKLDVGAQFTAAVRCADLTLGYPTRRGDIPGRALVDWKDAATGEKALVVNWAGDWPLTRIDSAVTEVKSLTITGGADVAEPFAVTGSQPPPGTVVIIDEDCPGQLKASGQPYDRRVAGVISGANGIHPGLALRQSGLGENGQNVALSGRVYVLADAAGGEIRPGDLLTTSSTPGHAMKVTDHTRAQGAVLGKAMTGLDRGRGMVLVLVTLQ